MLLIECIMCREHVTLDSSSSQTNGFIDQGVASDLPCVDACSDEQLHVVSASHDRRRMSGSLLTRACQPLEGRQRQDSLQKPFNIAGLGTIMLNLSSHEYSRFQSQMRTGPIYLCSSSISELSINLRKEASSACKPGACKLLAWMLRIKIGRFEKRATTSRCQNWSAPSSNFSVVDGMVLMLWSDDEWERENAASGGGFKMAVSPEGAQARPMTIWPSNYIKVIDLKIGNGALYGYL
jgi:hypothetical protein